MSALQDLLQQLTGGDEERAERAVTLLIEMGEEVIPALLDLSHAENADLRWWALRALAQSPHCRTEWLIPFLTEDPAPEVRQCAALGLAVKPDESATWPLVCALNDEDTMVGSLAVNALVKIGSPAVPSLIETVKTKKQSARINALRALAEIKELINEILDLAMIESGRMSWSMEPMSLTEVIRECQAMIEPQAQKRGVRVTFPVVDDPWFIKADRTRVKQALINLLSNAIKYNQPGGSVDIECRASAPQRVRVSVKDTGAGLDPEKLSQMFQPFNRLGQEAGSEEGTGIGLVVTKRLVELMGGTIGVESAVGVGSVFWIDLSVTRALQLGARDAERATHARPDEVDSVPLRTVLYLTRPRAAGFSRPCTAAA